jgi:hypothetical protein
MLGALIKKVTAATLLLLAILATAASAQAAPPQWYVGKAPITEVTPVILKSTLAFHYTDGAKHKFVSKCTATAEGTISNSGPEGAGVDELTKGAATECVTTPEFCQPGVKARVDLNFSSAAWPSHLVAGLPIRDEMFVTEVGVICIGREKSSNGWVSPVVKSSSLVFDKGHGNLLNNGGITITGSWKILTATKQKVDAK